MAIERAIPVEVVLAPPPVTNSPIPVVRPVPEIEAIVPVVAEFAMSWRMPAPVYTPVVVIDSPTPTVETPMAISTTLPAEVWFAPPPVISTVEPDVIPVALIRTKPVDVVALLPTTESKSPVVVTTPDEVIVNAWPVVRPFAVTTPTEPVVAPLCVMAKKPVPVYAAVPETRKATPVVSAVSRIDTNVAASAADDVKFASVPEVDPPVSIELDVTSNKLPPSAITDVV